MSHSVGANGWPVVLTQLAADPAHPATAGELIVVFSTEQTIHGQRDVVHTPDWAEHLFTDPHQVAEGTIEQGGLYMAGYRPKLEWLAQLLTETTGMTTKRYLQINAYRPDHAAIDEDDQTAAALTIDIDTDDDTTVDIALANGTSTPGGTLGQVEMRWELTEAQYTSLHPVDGNGARTYPKVGLTIAAASSVEPITFSSYAEAHAGLDEGEYYLRYHQTVGVQAPASGAWYARATNPQGSTLYVGD